ncbi:hypothetical protein C6P40_002949 [Pichia californica]|uniref:FAD dependent oxidoreductase domain-containing protein n=1 Tax=Pichia californica TaxID=460514 RepID=A0A9P7BCL5_9ASCO|nr:hypothetical protein C6P40_002949 [[Candida] californica]
MVTLIVGCGVFGLSTALELVREGHFVHIIDKYEPPSPWSAANDFNKIVRCEYNDPIHLKLAIEALYAWRSDPIYQKSFSECGRILVTPLSHQNRIKFEMQGVEMLKSVGEGGKYEIFKGGDLLGKKFPFLKDNSVASNQEVKYNPESGLGVSMQTLKDVYNYLKNHPNVICTFGDSGDVIGIKKYSDGSSGVITKSGYVHSASNILICAGANTGSILTLENQQSATGLYVTHIQLSNNEYNYYKDIPIIYDAELGYFFPPDSKTKIMKVCLSGVRVKRTVTDPFDKNQDVSLPRFHNNYPKDTIPKDSISTLRELLKKYVPELADHKFIGSKICWIGDREGSNFLIDQVPGYNNCYIATGDSGHAFKFFPIIGRYIIQRVQGKLDEELASIWKWKSKTNTEMFDGSNASWRVTKSGTLDITKVDFLIENEISKL